MSAMISGKRFGLLAAALIFGLGVTPALPQSDAERIALAVDALTRLENVDLDANAALKERVLKVLDKTRGTADFVKLVRHFKLTGQNVGLLEVAAARPAEESGVEAMRLVLASGDTEQAKAALGRTNTAAAIKLAEALGNTGKKEAVALLLPILTNSQRDLGLRQQAIRSLVRTSDGAKDLLGLAKSDKLSEDLKFTAGSELSSVRWPEIQAEAAKLLPPAQSLNAEPLPPVVELVKRTGDPANGAKVFARPSPGCANCHVIKSQGIELGPNLSEIGSKLGKDALYQSILEPSAGVSFGFEAWNLTLKNGDEAYGLIASETADEIAVKAVGGIVTRFKKADVASRQPSKLSIMPAGLQAGMTVQEFVDLVEYLASLKSPAGQR
jgi:putative heme-binding domain-containing protein